MKYILFALISIGLSNVACAKASPDNTMLVQSFSSKESFLFKTWSTHVTINLGSCQASGTITVTTNDNTGQVHVYYSLATNCGGSIHGTAGQVFRSGGEQGPLVVDPDSITYEYDSEGLKTVFETNKGKAQLQKAINTLLANE